MPSTSQAQQRYFGSIVGGAVPKPKGMTMDQVRDFASTPRKGLPKRAPAKHMADGGMFVEREGVAPGSTHWMELVRAGTVPAGKTPSQRMELPHMAEGRKPGVRPRSYYGEEHMADGKWMSSAFGSNKGGLHRATHTPEGHTIPTSKVRALAAHGSTHQRRMANAAINANPGRY